MISAQPGVGTALLDAGITPLKPGAYLDMFLEGHKHVSIAEAAAHMGVSEGFLGDIIANRTRVDPAAADILAAYTGLSAMFWLNAQAAADLANARPGHGQTKRAMPA